MFQHAVLLELTRVYNYTSFSHFLHFNTSLVIEIEAVIRNNLRRKPRVVELKVKPPPVVNYLNIDIFPRERVDPYEYETIKQSEQTTTKPHLYDDTIAPFDVNDVLDPPPDDGYEDPAKYFLHSVNEGLVPIPTRSQGSIEVLCS